MKKAIEVLGYGEPTCKEQFIKHITEMVNHEIIPGETFGDSFERLKKRFEGDKERTAAIKSFIENQDESVLSMVPWDAYELGDPEECGKQYHNFNIFDLQN